VAQRVGTGIALLFHDRGTRRVWVVSSTPWPHFTPGKDPVPNLQEAGWAPGPVQTGGKSRPHRDPIPVRQARSQSLYRLSYPAHTIKLVVLLLCLLIDFFLEIFKFVAYVCNKSVVSIFFFRRWEWISEKLSPKNLGVRVGENFKIYSFQLLRKILLIS